MKFVRGSKLLKSTSMRNSSDFYEVLNLPKDSSSQEIRKAYKVLAKKWHPDKHPISSKAEAEARFKAISQAYEALLNDSECRTTSRVHGINQTFNDQGFNRKSPPIERKLECTLEELYWGCKKEVRFTRDVITKTGLVIQKPESHTIAVQSGWKKGTKIIFESMGESSNFVFLISEKHHPLFKRAGNDLVLKLKVSLANALAGWSFSFVNLNGEKIRCSFHDEIISHGYEKVIRGKGMPIANQNGTRGDMRIKFHVVFPMKLSEEQRNVVAELLRDGK